MKLNLISKTVSEPHGVGNNWGETIIKKYTCPCGKGVVVKETETTTGYKSTQTDIECEECKKHYVISDPSSRNWDIIPKTYKE